MAVPKKRTSRRRKGMRRAHDALTFNAAVVLCNTCGLEKLAHHVCLDCGYYKGRKIFTTDFDPSGVVLDEASDLPAEDGSQSADDGSTEEASPE